MAAPIEMVDWKSPTLNKGQGMGVFAADCWMSVDHVDRTVDPYLAGVQHRGCYVYSGLHATLADARNACKDIVRSLG